MKSFENAWIELQNAREARASGLEGRARVCARRSAGLAIRDYLTEKNGASRHNSLFELIVDKSIRGLLPIQLVPHLDRLSLRVNQQFQLPDGVDLISEAIMVISLLETQLEE
jgi:hypothetical protein